MVSSTNLLHLNLNFNIQVIGASHLIQCCRWSELFSCAIGHSKSPVFSLGPDFSGNQPFKYQDCDLLFEFEIKRIDTRVLPGIQDLEEARSRLARSKVFVSSEFPHQEGDCPPSMTWLAVNPLEQGLEVSSLHYYSQESTAMLSRSVTAIQ